MLLKQADVAFLKDDDIRADELITHIEAECSRLGLVLYRDEYMED